MKLKILLVIIFVTIAPLSLQAQSNQEVSSNYSPVHWAAAQGYTEMLKVLTDKGYDINGQDDSGFTPLHYAAAAGKFDSVNFLVSKGADLYLVNKDNLTPMSLAAQAGEQKIVDFLFVKMRSTRVEQIKAQVEQERVNTDLAKAAKARAEAERLRQKAEQWTKEASFWKTEAQKWTREANLLKEKQIQLDQITKEKLTQAIADKKNALENYESERLARAAAERLLKEQSANLDAQLKAYQAQNAALAAQQATDIAIENLANEFIKQGISQNSEIIPPTLTTNSNGQLYFIDPNAPAVPVNILAETPVLTDDPSISLPQQATQSTNIGEVTIDPGLLQFGEGIAPQNFEESLPVIVQPPTPKPVIVEPEVPPAPVVAPTPAPAPVVSPAPTPEPVETNTDVEVVEEDPFANNDVIESSYGYDQYDQY
ncbi:MAG: ankyrin repeat domain-containing protein [Brevinema sp.]